MERDPILEAKAEDFKIVKYYGTYNGSYVILLNEPYFEYPAVIVDEWVTIGEVSFHNRGHGEIIVWKK